MAFVDSFSVGCVIGESVMMNRLENGQYVYGGVPISPVFISQTSSERNAGLLTPTRALSVSISSPDSHILRERVVCARFLHTAWTASKLGLLERL